MQFFVFSSSMLERLPRRGYNADDFSIETVLREFIQSAFLRYEMVNVSFVACF